MCVFFCVIFIAHSLHTQKKTIERIEIRETNTRTRRNIINNLVVSFFFRTFAVNLEITMNRIFNNIIFTLSLILMSLCTETASAQPDGYASATGQQQSIPEELIAEMDSVEIGFITCEPFHQIYALYGHTGLRIHNLKTHMDAVANWGVFDMSKSFFPVRFAFGLTDYSMAIEPFDGFCQRYQHFGSGVAVQVLNLTNEEKARIMIAIERNYRPENRVYRYNFFFDNCTTRARDIVLSCLDGEVKYKNEYQPKTFREAIHDHTIGHEWMEWGQDFLLGAGADKEMTREQAQFLPENMLRDFDNAVIAKDGKERKLVKTTEHPVPPTYKLAEPSPLTDPDMVAILIAILAIAVLITEQTTKRNLWQFDAFMLLLTGIPGLILFCMIFSQHPTVSLNLQILIYNPLAIVFFWPIVKHFRKNEHCWQVTVLILCAAIGAVFGKSLQHYSMGTQELALSLILITYSRRALIKKGKNIGKK